MWLFQKLENHSKVTQNDSDVKYSRLYWSPSDLKEMFQILYLRGVVGGKGQVKTEKV